MFNDFSNGGGGGGGLTPPNHIVILNNEFDTIGSIRIGDVVAGNPYGGPSVVEIVAPNRVVIRDCLIMPRPQYLPLRVRARIAWSILRGRRP